MLPYAVIAVLAAEGALVAAHTAVMLPAIVKANCCAAVRAFLKTWRAAWSAQESDMDKALRAEMQKTRLSNLRSTFWMGTLFFPLHCAMRSMRLLDVDASVAVLPGMCSPSTRSMLTRLNGLLITATNCALLHGPTNLAQHCVYFVVASGSLASSPVHREHLGRYVGVELLSAVVSCTCVVMMQRMVEAQHRSRMEAKGLMEKQAANNKLLSMFYEVVLEVDSDLTIVSSDPELGLFLPRGAGSPAPPLLGTSLGELLPDEQDMQLLRQRTLSPQSDEAEASVDVMHVNMRHGDNDSLRVELFSLRFQSFAGRWRHLLGVREFGAEGQLVRGVSGDGGQAGPAAALEPSLSLQVDTLDPSFAIVSMSADLRRELAGTSKASSFCQFLGDVTEFSRCFQVAVNTVLRDGDAEPFKAVLCPLGRRVHLLADCHVTLDKAPGGRSKARCMARLIFSNVIHLQQVPRSDSDESSSTGGSSSSSRGSAWLRGTPSQTRRQALHAESMVNL